MVKLYFCGKDIWVYDLTRVIYLGGKYSPPPLQRLIKIRNKSVNIICPLNYSSFTAQNQFPGLIHLPVQSVLKAGVSSVHPDSNQAYFNQLPTCQTPNNSENL